MLPENALDRNFWDSLWKKNETGWDIGYASPAIAEYMKQYANKNAAILIPGCGNAYEAAYLLKEGFTNITPLLRILTDHGTEYCGTPEYHEYELYLQMEGIDHSKTKARSPETNGICERFYRAIQDDFFR